MRPNTKTILATICAAGAIVSCDDEQQKERLPNVVIIFTDDMGYGDISAFNNLSPIKTPHIDQLASEGMAFTKAHASASVSTPSRYGLLTGRYAFRTERAQTGIWGYETVVIEPGRMTLGNLFQNAGYSTAIIGKWHLGLNWVTKDGKKVAIDSQTGYSNIDYTKPVELGPNDFGFEYSFIHPASTDMPPYLFLRNHLPVDPNMIITNEVYPIRLPDTEYSWDRRFISDNDIYWRLGVWWRNGELSASLRIEDIHTEIMSDAREYIDSHARMHKDKPFFLLLSLTGPHTPWLAEEPFRGKSELGDYGDFVLTMDHVVKDIRDALQKNGFSKNTIIIFTSDNGTPWPEIQIETSGHQANLGRRGQKGDVHDGGHRVPMIIHWPDVINQPRSYHNLVSLKDIFATAAELTEQEIPANAGEDSFSFLKVLRGDLDHVVRNTMVHHSSGLKFGIRYGEWKYIEGLGSGGFTHPAFIEPAPGEPTGQLYNIETDSLESENLFFVHPEIVTKLQNELSRLKTTGEAR